jgi:hypothetical protein
MSLVLGTRGQGTEIGASELHQPRNSLFPAEWRAMKTWYILGSWKFVLMIFSQLIFDLWVLRSFEL